MEGGGYNPHGTQSLVGGLQLSSTAAFMYSTAVCDHQEGRLGVKRGMLEQSSFHFPVG